MKKRAFPTAEERTDEVVALRDRVKVLEGHRDQWRKLAFTLYDELKKHDQAAGDAVFENYDRDWELRR